MKRKTYKELLLNGTEGLISSTVDFALYFTYVMLALPTRRTWRENMDAQEEGMRFIETVNYQTIKYAVRALTKQKLISRTNPSPLAVVITKEGKKRLEEIIPTYRSKRPWDGHIYLISYDIPKKVNLARNLLRTHIKRTGGVLLQESLWLNPYNPTLLLHTFTAEHAIPGTILVSKLGTDGTIGDEKLSDVLHRLYNLDKLAQRYQEFIQMYKGTGRRHGPLRASFAFLSILRDDPQIPFELLPNEFPGIEAYSIYQRICLSSKIGG